MISDHKKIQLGCLSFRQNILRLLNAIVGVMGVVVYQSLHGLKK